MDWQIVYTSILLCDTFIFHLWQYSKIGVIDMCQLNFVLLPPPYLSTILYVLLQFHISTNCGVGVKLWQTYLSKGNFSHIYTIFYTCTYFLWVQLLAGNRHSRLPNCIPLYYMGLSASLSLTVHFMRMTTQHIYFAYINVKKHFKLICRLNLNMTP